MAAGLTIDWTQMPTYNTIMAVAAGAALLTLVWLGRSLLMKKTEDMEGRALALGVPGLILTATGLHMTLTWPFAKYFPFDNIIFGEPSLAFGVLCFSARFTCGAAAPPSPRPPTPSCTSPVRCDRYRSSSSEWGWPSGRSRSPDLFSGYSPRHRKSPLVAHLPPIPGSKRSSCRGFLE